MARIVIIDDEYFVRMGIKTIVNQRDKGYIVVGEAENGTEAVSIISEQNPDIVFLDITMPGMDGLQVLENVRKVGYKGYVAMLTCHEDFHFAQQAMRNGADDYVLKNELVGESMLSYLDKVTERLHTNLMESGKQEVKEREKQKELHFYKENFLRNILQMGGLSKEEFNRGCERYHVKIKADGIYIITIHIKEWEKIVERYRESNLQVFFEAIDNMMCEIFHSYPEWEGFYSEPYRFHILFTCSSEKSVLLVENHIREIINNIVYHFERILDIEIVMAVYRNTYPIEELCKGYQKAGAVLDQSFFWKEKNLFWDGIHHIYRNADLREFERILTDDSREDEISTRIEQYLAKQKDY